MCQGKGFLGGGKHGGGSGAGLAEQGPRVRAQSIIGCNSGGSRILGWEGLDTAEGRLFQNKHEYTKI